MPYIPPKIIHDLPPRNSAKDFAEQYLALRRKEQRVYSDEEVRQLPAISVHNPHYKEWIARKHSCNRLLKYIGKLETPPDILEIGCGNGWLSHKLSTAAGTEVTGYDINQAELQQAKKLFGHRLNLQFISQDPFAPDAKKELYDVIVFAASIQYFPSLAIIVEKAMERLQPGGSTHIIDSHFYKPGDVAAAKQRTMEYYASMGFPELGEHYFHHSLDELSAFNYEILYNPRSTWNRLMQRSDPFYWICIKKNK